MYNRYRIKYIQYGSHRKQLFQSTITSLEGGVRYINTDGNTYTGAGVILVEQYNNKAGKNELAVILFRNNGKANVYEDLGGNIEEEYTRHKFPLTETAKNEAFEESACLISFANTQHIDQYNTFIKCNEYRCYFVGILPNTFFRQDYLDNVKKLNMFHDIPNQFKETDDVQRFYIADLIRNDIMNKSNNMKCVDAHGKERMLSSRAIVCIREGLRKDIPNSVIRHPLRFVKTSISKFGLHLNTFLSTQ